LITKTLADFQLQDDCVVRTSEDESHEIIVPEVAQKIVVVDKDNIYYKQTNRNLKCKLREMINTFDSEKQV
jgi:tRNA uridine 5-carbamoylmethylation protein Kti12